ncbi:MAG TPA: hypothetical protein VFK11_04990 [Candidatus Saccharimonadales bacterium]|nr:hypothetical protein [Candidatus Saccharimonadales bacterium]
MKWPHDYFENGYGYIRLEDLKLGELPKNIKVDGSELVIKQEFHISLVWVGRLKEMVNEPDKEKIKKEMIAEFEQFTKEHPMTDFDLTKELRLVNKEGRKSVIAMAEVPGIEAFFERLSRKYDVNLPVQPTHITLYTLPTDKIGIGILSYGELDAYTEPIDFPEIQDILKKT